jgi:hypothetical protein
MAPKYKPEAFLFSEARYSQSFWWRELLDVAIGESGMQLESNVKNDVRKNKFSGWGWAELV